MGFEPWVSRLQDRHANHYTTAAYTTQHLTLSQELNMVPPTGLTTCLLLTLSTYLQVSCQAHYALTKSYTTNQQNL